MNRRSSIAAALLVMMLGLACAWRLQAGIDRQLAATHQERDDLLLRSSRLVRALSLEYQTFMADVYWTRAVQYYGEKHFRHDANLELLWPLLDLSTSLDPQLLDSYSFGGIFLAQDPPDGAGRPEQAITLLQRGIAANPDQWRLYSDLGFVYYMDVHDYQKASAAFLEGSKNPKAQIWMKVMAAKVAGEGQSFESSMFLWREIYESSNDHKIRENALNQMRMLKAEQDLRGLNELLFEFEQQNMRLATDWTELVRAGLLGGVPLDPMGLAYKLDSTGRAQLNSNSPLVGPPANPAKHK